MKKVKVFYMEHCPHCKKLMDNLDELNIPYEKVNVDTKEGEDEFIKLHKLTNSDNIPVIIVGYQVLVPEIAFVDIDGAIKIILELYNK